MKGMRTIEVGANRVGIIKTLNYPIYRRFSMLMVQSQKQSHRLILSLLSEVVIMIIFRVKVISDSPAEDDVIY